MMVTKCNAGLAQRQAQDIVHDDISLHSHWSTNMLMVLLLIFLVSSGLVPSEIHARQRVLSPQEKQKLQQARTIRIYSLALTERGAIDSHMIQEVVARRLRALGYSVVVEKQKPHDLILKVKCEERKTWLGPTRLGGDADSPLAPSRVWKGPACQITYHFPTSQGSNATWRREIRTPFANALRAAKEHQVKDSGAYAMHALAAQLEHDPFPLLLAAEWGHAHRLIQALDQPDTSLPLKKTIISLLGTIPGPESLAALQSALADPTLAPLAATALGYHGSAAIPLLLTTLERAHSSELATAAVTGLGTIGTHYNDPILLDTLLTILQQSHTAMKVKIEIVKALGKLGDQRAIPVLEELNRAAWTDPSRTPDMQQFRDALSWSLWQLIPEAHTAE